jgi:hypothetical protein
MQLIGGIDSTGLYATVAQDYLYDNAGTAAREPISALRAKQDALSFGYDGNNSITSINTSSLAGGGDMSTSDLAYDGNYITAYDRSSFKDMSITADLTNLQTVSSTVNSNSSTWNAALSGVSVDGTPLTVTNNIVNVVLSGKVDAVDGKGLSTNDYTNAATAVVANASAVIPSDAAANNQLVSNSTMQAAIANVGHFEIAQLGQNDEPSVQNPSTKIFYLTKPNSAAATDPYTEWIYTTGGASPAWNVIGSTQIDLNGYAKVPTAYTANHILTYDSTTQTLLDAGVTTADLEGSITAISVNGSALPISQKSVNIPLATTTTDGALGSADKVKLDGIESGANVNVQADWAETSTASDAYIENKPDIVIPLTSNAFAAPTNIVVVSAMPSSPDPTTIYLVKEAT